MSEFSERIVKQTEALLHFQHDETLQETTPERLHEALGQVIMMEISDNWTKTKRRQAPGRRAFYFSAEYLVGRLVYSNLFNLGILRGMKAAFAEKGVDLACLEHIEDAALGNGGLGRLAACFLDSAATLDLPLTGYGLRYRFGLFKQSFVNGCQRENADDWTKYGDPWSHRRDKLAVKVKFADQTVNCVPYDMPVIGYETTTVGTLRLWQCEAEEELNFLTLNAKRQVHFNFEDPFKNRFQSEGEQEQQIATLYETMYRQLYEFYRDELSEQLLPRCTCGANTYCRCE